MNHFVLFAMSVGFGSFAWMMLALSDWLLGDKPKRPASQRLQSPSVEHPNVNSYANRNASPRGIVPTARKAS